MDLAHVELFPAVCGLCRRSPERGELFVDTQRNIRDGQGPQRERLYVCRECGGQVAAALGFVPGDELESALEELDGLQARSAELEAQVEEDSAFLSRLRGLVAPDAASEADSGE